MTLTRRDFLKVGAGAFLIPPWVVQQAWCKSGRVPVLLYHDISKFLQDDYTLSPAQFAAQMEWLYSEGYQTLFLDELRSVPEGTLEKKIILTFDGGYASFIDYVLPLLEIYQFKGTLNLIGQKVGTFIHLGGNRPLLSWDECRYLLRSGLVDLGCHTYGLHHSRGVLSVSDSELQSDLQQFQEVAMRETGRSFKVLAWPYGLFREKSVEVAKKLGFQYFLTSTGGFFQKGLGWENIPRLNINYKFDLNSFRKYLGREEK